MHGDRGIDPLDLRFGANVEQRIGRAFAAEADDPALEPEPAPGELIIAANEVGLAGEARRVGASADVEVGRPAAVDPEPAHGEVAPRDLDVERPRRELRDLDHLGRVGAGALHVELGTRDAADARPSVKRPLSSANCR